MARLPTIGGDDGTWGDILNDYLSQAHKTDGTLKDNSVGAATIQSGAVTKTDVGLAQVDNTSDANKPVSTAQAAADNLRVLKAGDIMTGDLSVGTTSDSAELITNQVDRDFSGSTNWAGANWAVVAGALQHTPGSTTNAILSNSMLTPGSITALTTYKVTVTVTGQTAGTVVISLTSGGSGTITTNGTYTCYIVSTFANQDMRLVPSSTFDGSVDNISIVRVAQPIYMNASNSYFGIGTNNPQRRFVIQADSDGSYTALALYNRSMFNSTASVMSFRTDTIGAGATAFVELVALRAVYELHDHATRSANFGIFTTSSGTTAERFRIAPDGKVGIGTTAPNEILDIRGNLTLGAAGNGIKVKEGSNATMGQVTLIAGTVTVSTTKVTATSRILLTVQSLGTVTVPAAVGVTARTVGTSFVITSSQVSDTSQIAWFLLEPAA